MQQFKKHIAVIFLAGFLFPQVASSIHYSILPHGIATGEGFVFTQSNPDLRFHWCLFLLNGLPKLLPIGKFEEITLIQTTETPAKFYSLKFYVHQPDFHFQLRGPPESLQI